MRWLDVLKHAPDDDGDAQLDVEYQRRLLEGGAIKTADIRKVGTDYDPKTDAQEIERLSVRLSSTRHQQNEARRQYRETMEELAADEADTVSQMTEIHARMEQWVRAYSPPTTPPEIPETE
jgi:hypothetical protein